MSSPSSPAFLRGALLVSLAAISWGTTGSVSTLLAERAGATPLLVGAARMVVAAAVLLVASRLTRAARLPRAARRLTAAMGACMAAYQIFFFAAVAVAGIAIPTLVAISSAPLIIALLARVVLGDRMPRRTRLALVVGVTGTAVLVSGGHAPGQAPATAGAGALLALAAGASYALYAILAKLTLARSAPLPAAAATFVVAAIILLPVFPLVEAPGRQIAAGWPWLLYLGSVATAGAYAAYTTGLREIPASTAGVLGLLEPLTAAGLAVALFGERLSPAGLAGAALVLCALLLLARRP